jgi:hypothetical protein
VLARLWAWSFLHFPSSIHHVYYGYQQQWEAGGPGSLAMGFSVTAGPLALVRTPPILSRSLKKARVYFSKETLSVFLLFFFFLFCFVSVLVCELRAYILRHSTSPFL